MYNVGIYKNRKLNEQAAVISDNPNERLKGYLDNEDFLEALSGMFRSLEDGETTNTKELGIDNKEYGILEDDMINIKVDKSDPNSPKFTMWVMNDEFMFGDVDIDLAAELFHQSTKGDYGILGTVNNYLGSLVGLGDPGDDGTDEDKLIGVAAALGAIASQKGNLDPKIYFDKLAERYQSKFGESINNALETEFSGRAEAVALNTFRQGVSDSTSRGVNLPSILGDIALTIVTFGSGTVAKTALQGTKATAKAIKYTGKLKNAAKAEKAIEKGSKLAKITNKLTASWNGLSDSVKLARAKKLIGKPLEYTTEAGKTYTKTIEKIVGSGKNAQIIWAGAGNGPLIGNIAVDAGAKLSAKSLAMLVPGTAGKVALAGGVATGKAEAAQIGSMNPAELMGWYDSLTADPNSYISSIGAIQDEKDYSTLASMIMELKQGSGIWGNTTNQEELAMALIITSLSPEGAKEVMTEYQRIDPGNTVYAVLDDELGGDMGQFAKTWWAALTGDGADNHPSIQLYKTQINKKVKKK